MRFRPLAALVLLAACSRGPQPSIVTPSSAPVMHLPEQVEVVMAPRSDAEWKALGDEAARLLSQYLQINTTNPPGNEIEAARWLKAVLAREGIQSQIFEPRPGKANLYARLEGDGSARPIVLLNHMDVVLASPEYWRVPPFSGAIRDGAVWGRGALDMKGEGVVQLMTMIILKRAGVPLKRDIIFLATADEEVGQGVGAQWFVEHHRALIQDAELLINEGGTIRAGENGRVDYVGVGTTEKSPFWLDMTARGTPGHGSRPTPDNPVHRLVRAVERIVAHETPLVVTPTVERYFRDLARTERDSLRRRWYQDIRTALQDPAAARMITGDLYYNAILRNTVTVTGLKGSEKTNVIPPVATAVLDVRLLPGQDPQAFLAELNRVVDDTAVTLEPQGVNWPATESGADTDVFRAVVDAARVLAPDALVTSTMLAGFTDSHYFRRIGIASYGVAPFPLTPEDSRGVHGNDERVSLQALAFGVRFYYEIVRRVAGK